MGRVITSVENGVKTYDALDELDKLQAEKKATIERLKSMILTTENYLKGKSSMYYDEPAYRNHLLGEISGYKIAVNLLESEGK